MTPYAVVLTTCSDKDAAQAIARALVDKHLSACVQMLPIESIYTWKGEREEAHELLLLAKIKGEDYAEVERAILALHPYETPEIIALPIAAGFGSYLDWIASATARTTS